MDPSASVFGPSPKVCSSCHNAHGDRDAAGAFYRKLLRSSEETTHLYGWGTQYFRGTAYCAACHATAPAGYSVDTTTYQSTVHYTDLPDPPSGTQVRCSVCHAPHGSDVAPLLSEQTSGAAVTGNDKSECYACHPVALRSFDGSATYNGSVHGRATGSFGGRVMSACQQCHDPHGARDLVGVLPRLTRYLEESLCYRCHAAAGPASDDLESWMPTAGASPRYEVVLSVTPTPHAGADSRLAVLSQETSGGAPRELKGPYEVAADGGVRSVAVGDVDGDGRSDAVIGRRSADELLIARQTAAGGLVATQSVTTTSPADDLAVGDVTGDGQRDVVFVSRAAGRVSVYEWSAGTLSLTRSYETGGALPSAVTLGYVDGGTRLDAVVANTASDTVGLLLQNGSGSFDPAVTVATEASPTGVAIGDLDVPSTAEVAASNSASDSVSLFSWSGADLSLVGTYAVTSASTATPRDVAIGDVLGGYDGRELVVSLSHDTSQSGLDIFRCQVTTAALTFVQEATTGVEARTWDVDVADVDADGSGEVVVGNGGTFLGSKPTLGVFDPATGTSLGLQRAYRVGGGQDGGGRARLAVGDLGSLYPYRHDVAVTQRTHDSTETFVAASARHVECPDCHDSMTADTQTASAPGVPGALKGAYGMRVINHAAGSAPDYAPAKPVATEYEVCFKCHSGAAGQSGVRDIASLMNTANASFHPVEGAGKNVTIGAGAWTGSWTVASRTYCGDCHTRRPAASPVGPHLSSEPAILAGPYVGAGSSSEAVCYGCHRYGAYYDADEATATPASRFYDGEYATPQLHSFHVKGNGLDCRACHVVHGQATVTRLLRDDVGFSFDPGSGPYGTGTCTASGCHAASRSYQALYP
jgi:predicted CXXCH cytochrome family protein